MRVIDIKNAGQSTGVFVVVACLYPFSSQNSARQKKAQGQCREECAYVLGGFDFLGGAVCHAVQAWRGEHHQYRNDRGDNTDLQEYMAVNMQ